ncbi:MAG: carboxypeptidase-like regulatory domain-containing protein [Jaaginema sp. PMC 1079.18]|nr:carboxypeptidase-like regulatory domain-containing protein [Jaaginema sp. PMC 1080.18]MEC4851417.1 carboxypeptidase-like regulatory domain-containing protein [Jaaginema sp. PMC 1079.18]MEC4866195.1 carboxypeptidase-like regulatory domain-containing protein [Jaaginema sp. PMC 1078.18]
MNPIKPHHFLLFCAVLGCSTPVFAHGANISFQQTSALEIEAKYDDGKPLKNASVTVYAPSDPATPWLTGQTDTNGKFTFSPDPTLTGNWDVKVRQAGHGDFISIPMTQNGVSLATAGTSGYTLPQKVLMAAVGLWGCVGTALFFSRRKPIVSHAVPSESPLEEKV